jgi:hypothetical protein
MSGALSFAHRHRRQCSTRDRSCRSLRARLCAQLLQIFYSIRTERLLMLQMDYNPLFQWSVEGSAMGSRSPYFRQDGVEED